MNRDLERKVSALNGRKWLYALTYHTEEEFWNIYDREKYNALREKYHATYLPTIYDKVKVNVEAEERMRASSWIAWVHAMFWSVWPLRGVYGVYKAVGGGDYLLSRDRVLSHGLLTLIVVFVSFLSAVAALGIVNLS